jgi:alkylhydroperoxidase family enzyme
VNLREELVERVLDGPGHSTREARRAAFDNQGVPEQARTLLDKVAKHAWKVTDEDVAALRQAGMSDDEIFELTIAAALGQSTRQLESALAVLDAAEPKQHDEQEAGAA